MITVTLDHFESGPPYRSKLKPDNWCSDIDVPTEEFTSLRQVRDVLAKRRTTGRRTTGVRIEFDCPIMQAAYDLGPEESKIT